VSSYRTDEAFAITPLWVLESDASDRACRLYGLLSGMRDYGTDMATVGRKKLAKLLHCSEDSLDRAKAELEKLGAITVERGERVEGGAIPRNVYTIHRTRTATRTGAATPIAAQERLPDTRTDAAMYEREQNENPPPPTRQGRAPTQIGGKKVTAEEESFAIEVLGVFNEISGRAFASKETLGKIVLRHREHADLDVAGHRAIIEGQFAAPWWSGDPSPSVIYGNGEVFDRALNNVRGNGQTTEREYTFTAESAR
jgi:hypothetical protein